MTAAAADVPEWLDSEFIQKLLRESTHDDGLTVEKFSSRAATKKGDNYGSDMYRVEVYVRRADGKVNPQSLIVKLPPSAEEVNHLMMDGGLFQREMNMFADTLPRIAALLGERIPFATALYTRVDPYSLIVLEDLAVDGYRMAQRTQGLDLDHASLCMKTLGRYHAATVALLQGEPSLLQLYTRNVYSEPAVKESMSIFVDSTLRALAVEVESWPDVGKDYAARLQRLRGSAYEKLVQASELDPEDFPVLIHGDLWVNNMLFHYNDSGEADDVKFVDFQLATISSPAIDLNYFLHTSLSDDLRRDHCEPLLREYHSYLCDAMDNLGLSQHKPSFERILQDCDRKGFHTLYSTICVWPNVMNKSEDGFDFEAVLKGEQLSNVWGRKTLNAGIRRMLPEFDKKGLF